MPAPTRSHSTRPRSPRPPARPRAATFRPVIASDGLTVDTDLGFVDLVAVKRALAGDDRVRLTNAELDWIRNPHRPGAVRQAADALGTGYTGLLRDITRRREVMRAEDRAAAELADCPF
jgi:hypothetical protein